MTQPKLNIKYCLHLHTLKEGIAHYIESIKIHSIWLITVTPIHTKAVSVIPNNKKNNQNLLAHLLLKFQTQFINFFYWNIKTFLYGLIFIHFFAANLNVHYYIYKLCLINFLYPDDLQNVVTIIKRNNSLFNHN